MTEEELRERLNLYEAMFERNPRDGLVSVAKTYLYILAGQPQEALKSALEASLSVSSKSLRVQLAIALGYYLRNKPGEALIESRYALNIDPAGPLCHLVHASILLALHRTDEARLAFLKCLSLASDNTFLTDLRLRNRAALCTAQASNPVLAAYSNLRLRAPDMTEAEVEQLVAQNPTDPVLKALLASLERRGGKIREALALLESTLATYEAFPERLYLLWKTYDDQLGNHQKGETFVRRLLEVDPLNDRATGLAYSYLDEEALHTINFIRSLEDLPDSIFARVLPIAELEKLVAVQEPAVCESAEETPAEQKTLAVDRAFVLPAAPRPLDTPPAVETAASPQQEDSLPPQPVLAHMATMLEQAEMIARQLKPAIAPIPLVQPAAAASESAPIAPPEASASPLPTTEEMPVRAEETPIPVQPSTERAAREEAVPVVQDLPSEPGASARTTLRDANQLLAQARYEEALRAFLALSRQGQ